MLWRAVAGVYLRLCLDVARLDVYVGSRNRVVARVLVNGNGIRGEAIAADRETGKRLIEFAITNNIWPVVVLPSLHEEVYDMRVSIVIISLHQADVGCILSLYECA